MKTFKQLLKESTVTDPEEMADLIIRDCQPYLHAIDNDPGYSTMWRGMGGATRAFMEKRVRTDRNPVTTPKIAHDFIDEFFYDKFGQEFRSNAIFVSGSQQMARLYGNLYAIFPIDDFEFLWSPDVHDLYYDLPTRIRHDDKDELTSEDKAELIELLTHARYRTRDLESAIIKGNEIMISANRYYAVEKSLYIDSGFDSEISVGRILERKLK